MADEQRKSAAVLFADRFYMSPASLAGIDLLGGCVWLDARDEQDLAAKAALYPSARVLVSEYIRVDENLLEHSPGLRGVIAYGAGYDHIDVRAAFRRNVQVCNCHGENAQAVAELAFGLLLCLIRRIHQADRWLREGGWERAGRNLPAWVIGGELYGKTLGIIGLGQIGSRVARIARGFDMKILAHDPFARSQGGGDDRIPLEDLLSRADVVTLHVPLTPATEKMIDARILEKMKPGVYLVNTSRGRVIDEAALLQGLRERRIRGAALDVFAAEPLPPGHPLTLMDQVVLSPHMGAMTQEAGDRLADAVCRQSREILEGRAPECLIRVG